MRLRRFFASTLACLALVGPVGFVGLTSGCGGGSKGPAAPAPAPAISSFTAAKSAITSGTSTTLTAVFANGVGTLTPGSVAVTSGTAIAVSPAITTTYTLTVVNSTQQSLSQTTTVTVVAAPAIASFAPAALGVVAGATTTLTPTFSGGTGSIDHSVGAVTSGQVVTVSPTSPTTYTLTVTNDAGTAVTAQSAVGIITSPATGAMSITADTKVTAGKGGRVASTQNFGPTTVYAWTLTNGRITAGQGTPSITYTPGLAGTLGLAVSATNGLGTASASTSATVTAALPLAKIFSQDKVHPGAATEVASVPGGPGLSIAWSLSGGTINGPADQPVLSYTAPATAGPFTLSATVSNATGDVVTDTRTAQVVAGEWLADPRVGRAGGSGWSVLHDGRVLALNMTPTWSEFSAYNAYFNIFDKTKCQLLDLATGTYRMVGDVGGDFQGSTHVHTLQDGRVLGLVGYTSDQYPWPFANFLYDPATETWSQAAPLPTGHLSPIYIIDGFHSQVMADGRVMVLGGFLYTDLPRSWANTFTKAVHIYDPATDTWSAAAPMHEARGYTTSQMAGFEVVPLRNGKVFVTAGGEYSRPYDPAVSAGITEIYDPVTDRWTQVAQAVFPQDPYYLDAAGSVMDGWGTYQSFGSGELPDGRVFVYGLCTDRLGADGRVMNQGHGFVALYDPAANAWSFRHHDVMPAVFGTLGGLGLPSGKILFGGMPPFDFYGHSNPGFPTTLYDPALDTSTPIAALPVQYDRWGNVVGPTPDFQLLPDGRVARLAYNGSSILDAPIYDPATDTWALPPAEEQPRYQHTATTLANGQVLFVGGVYEDILNTSNTDATLRAQIYDPAQGWRLVGSLLQGRVYHGAALLADGRALVAGGNGTPLINGGTGLGDTVLAEAEAYDPATETFSTVAPMGTRRFSLTLTTLADGRVLAAGGANMDLYLNTAEIYDPVHDTWTPTAPMNVARADSTATRLPDGRVLVVGGGDRTHIWGSAEVYDPAQNSWTATPPPLRARRYHRSVLLKDGRVLVTGGQTANGGVPNDAEIYDPATNRWSFGGSYDGAREYHGITLLADGKVLLSGGQNMDASTSQATCVVYDPATNGWTTTGSLLNSRGSHTATLLADGRVLVFGGNHHYLDPTVLQYKKATLSMPEFWK